MLEYIGNSLPKRKLLSYLTVVPSNVDVRSLTHTENEFEEVFVFDCDHARGEDFVSLWQLESGSMFLLTHTHPSESVS